MLYSTFRATRTRFANALISNAVGSRRSSNFAFKFQTSDESDSSAPVPPPPSMEQESSSSTDTNQRATEKPMEEDLWIDEMERLTPTEIVNELNKYIIGQDDAKKAVAVALRNRWRRKKIPASMKEDVIPKNILMVGPTGCGKTEIARRLAKLIDAPFIKVEATKFTELGFHGRDVDQIIRDLVEISLKLTKQKVATRFQKEIADAVENAIFAGLMGEKPTHSKEEWQKLYREGALDDYLVEIDVPVEMPKPMNIHVGPNREAEVDFAPFLGPLLRSGDRSRKRKVPISEAKKILEKKERERAVDNDTLIKMAIKSAEQNGIVFIDEIDKIATGKERYRGPDPSAEGVQRDLLPVIEGSIMNTKYGNVDTSKMLFIASGAFHSCKPSDLLAELQGRLPIRVELKALDLHDLIRVLTETKNNQISQNIELLKTEGVDLKFTDGAIKEIARISVELNNHVENLGARRLYAVIEKIVEEVSFSSEKYKNSTFTIDEEYVSKALKDMMKKIDLKRFVI